MPRRTRPEIEADRTPPPEGTKEYWDLMRARASYNRIQTDAQIKHIHLQKLKREVLPVAEMQDMFLRVFQSYRQSINVITRKYGKEAGEILAAAERSAIRTAKKEQELCSTISAFGKEPAMTSKSSAASPNTPNKK